MLISGRCICKLGFVLDRGAEQVWSLLEQTCPDTKCELDRHKPY